MVVRMASKWKVIIESIQDSQLIRRSLLRTYISETTLHPTTSNVSPHPAFAFPLLFRNFPPRFDGSAFLCIQHMQIHRHSHPDHPSTLSSRVGVVHRRKWVKLFTRQHATCLRPIPLLRIPCNYLGEKRVNDGFTVEMIHCDEGVWEGLAFSR